jgi:hypothetical protein
MPLTKVFESATTRRRLSSRPVFIMDVVQDLLELFFC